MKKKKVYLILIVALGAFAAINLKMVSEANRTFDLALLSVKGLSQESGGNTESNNHGSGMFFYEHLKGKPEVCTLYRNVHVDGKVEISSTDRGGEVNWSSSRVEGMRERCPKDGNGCTVYSCRQT